MPAASRIRLAVEVSGANKSAEAFGAMAERAYNTLPLTEMLVRELFDISRKRVDRAPWAPLTDGTVARKNAQGEDSGILRDEWRPIKGVPTRKGDLLYTALTQWGAPGQYKRATRTMATFGVQSAGQGPLFYARFVQNVKGKKRRILAVSRADAAGISEMVVRYITSGLISAGRGRTF